MNKIDFKHPRYVIPLISLPFILLLFYLYHNHVSKYTDTKKGDVDLQSGISPVSSLISDKGIEDKLEAFRQRYKKGDGYTAIGTIEAEKGQHEFSANYNDKQKRMLDSISLALKSRRQAFSAGQEKNAAHAFPDASMGFRNGSSDNQLNKILTDYQGSIKKKQQQPADPMAMFRAQMAIVDSMNKASLAPIQRPGKEKNTYSKPLHAFAEPPIKVTKVSSVPPDSFTIVAKDPGKGFMHAMVDQSLTGFNGSRVPLRLLDDLRMGDLLLKKGGILYASITGFSAQRVQLTISWILKEGKVYPVKMEIYDLDGLKGLYVPSSAYREFSKELASSSVSGLNIESSGDQNQQLMSLLGRMFQSTTGAVNKLIRSNKAHIRYSAMVYLIDTSS